MVSPVPRSLCLGPTGASSPMTASTRTELGACARCYLDDEGGTGWHLCPEHQPDRRPRSLNAEAHIAQARAVLATHQLQLVDE